ncbi:MAG TPA: toll/interleukin-1 receptor domain-containing protein [Phycisphaerales bacterium]
MPSKEGHPTAFISYTWESKEHKEWVRTIAARLRSDGVDVKLDLWECAPGDQLPAFMETAIRENDYALIVCTPTYKHKSEKRLGGAGYEGDVMTSEVFSQGNHRKFIPVLRLGAWAAAAPSWLTAKYRIDLSSEPYAEDQYQELLDTLHGRREQAPPIGPIPPPRAAPAAGSLKHIATGPQTDASRTISDLRTGSHSGLASASLGSHHDNDPNNFRKISIGDIIPELVGKPRNDGTEGCALFPVAFRLSRKPPQAWTDIFIERWDRPFGMHRPRTLQINGDTLTITKTTWDELERACKPALKACLDHANHEYVIRLRKEIEARDRERAKEREWNTQVREQASKFRID